MHKEINMRLHSENACFYLVLDILAACILFKNTKSEIFEIKILSLFRVGVKFVSRVNRKTG